MGAILAGCTLICTACSFMPAEEEKYHITLSRTETDMAYELAAVTRGDVVLTNRLYAQYQEENGEELSFGTDGREVEAVYVSKGDHIEKGTLLAKLACADLEEEKTTLEYEITRNELLKKQALERLEFDKGQLGKLRDSYRMSLGDYNTAVADLERNVSEEIEDYDDALEVARIKQKQVSEKLEGCSICSGMDGTIAYISVTLTNGNNNYSAGMTVIRVVDTSHCIFVMENDGYKDYPDYFKEGNTVELTNNAGEIYKTTVMAASKDQEMPGLELNELDERLTIGTRLFCVITVDERKNVLKLPPAAIHQAMDKYYVYKTDESGLKTIAYITVGLIGDDSVEVLDGLKEGDIVIKK